MIREVPWESGHGLGMGVDLASGDVVSMGGIFREPLHVEESAGMGIEWKIFYLESSSSVSEAARFSASASYSSFGAKGSAKLSFTETESFSSSKTYALFSLKWNSSAETAPNSFYLKAKLNDAAEKLKHTNPDDITKKYGTGFIAGRKRGGWVEVLLEMNASTKEQKKAMSAEVQFRVNSFGSKFEGKAGYNHERSKQFSSMSKKLSFRGQGLTDPSNGDPHFDFFKMIDQCKKAAHGGGTPYQAIVASYKTLDLFDNIPSLASLRASLISDRILTLKEQLRLCTAITQFSRDKGDPPCYKEYRQTAEIMKTAIGKIRTADDLLNLKGTEDLFSVPRETYDAIISHKAAHNMLSNGNYGIKSVRFNEYLYTGVPKLNERRRYCLSWKEWDSPANDENMRWEIRSFGNYFGIRSIKTNEWLYAGEPNIGQYRRRVLSWSGSGTPANDKTMRWEIRSFGDYSGIRSIKHNEWLYVGKPMLDGNRRFALTWNGDGDPSNEVTMRWEIRSFGNYSGLRSIKHNEWLYVGAPKLDENRRYALTWNKEPDTPSKSEFMRWEIRSFGEYYGIRSLKHNEWLYAGEPKLSENCRRALTWGGDGDPSKNGAMRWEIRSFGNYYGIRSVKHNEWLYVGGQMFNKQRRFALTWHGSGDPSNDVSMRWHFSGY